MLPLHNVATLMASNFFFLLLASMYLVLYMEIKTLGTACNKTALLLFVACEERSYNYSRHELKSIFLFNVPTIFTYSILHYSHFNPSCFGMTLPPTGSKYQAKVIYNKVDYISEFHNLQCSLLLIPLFVWIKYVNFLIYCVHYV